MDQALRSQGSPPTPSTQSLPHRQPDHQRSADIASLQQQLAQVVQVVASVAAQQQDLVAGHQSLLAQHSALADQQQHWAAAMATQAQRMEASYQTVHEHQANAATQANMQTLVQLHLTAEQQRQTRHLVCAHSQLLLGDHAR